MDCNNIIFESSKIIVSKVLIDDTIYILKAYKTHFHAARNEIKYLKYLVHPNIIKYFCDSCENFNIKVLLEYCSYYDLTHYIKINGKFSEIEILNLIVKPLVDVLGFLYQKNVIHRDIKPENIFINSNKIIKLGDFENAIDFAIKPPTTVVGTLEFMAPEIIILSFRTPEQIDKLDKVVEPLYDTRADIWSFGILIYELMFGSTPFYDLTDKKVIKNILTKKLDIPTTNISNNAISFIMLLLQRNKQNRPTANMLLSHDWLKPLHSIVKKSSSLPELTSIKRKFCCFPVKILAETL